MKFLDAIKNVDGELSAARVLEVKAAIWALVHIGTTEMGLNLLEEHDAMAKLMDLAFNCPILSIKGYLN